jgi:thioredoxin reductase
MSALASKTGLTAPSEGLDARVGREMGREMGWLMRRTKRVEELLAEPAVMEMADRLARHMEQWARIEEVDVKDLEVTVLPSQTKTYIQIAFGARPCIACSGTGRLPDGVHYCPTCDGSGVR